jgi:hypothetical protein
MCQWPHRLGSANQVKVVLSTMQGNANCPRRSFEEYWSLSNERMFCHNLIFTAGGARVSCATAIDPGTLSDPTLQLPIKGPRANEGLPCKSLFTATQVRCAADRSSPSHHGSAECRRSPSGSAYNSRPADRASADRSAVSSPSSRRSRRYRRPFRP